MKNSTLIGEFFYYIRSVLNFFLGKEKTLNYKLNKQDADQCHDFVNQIATDDGSNINISVGQINFSVYSIEANAIQNGTRRFKEELKSENPVYFEKELMYWANASFIKKRKLVGDKVIIENIYKSPVRVTFRRDEDRELATTHNDAFPGKDWQDLAYKVDVKVSYIEDIPKEYEILKIYKDEIFDPED